MKSYYPSFFSSFFFFSPDREENFVHVFCFQNDPVVHPLWDLSPVLSLSSLLGGVTYRVMWLSSRKLCPSLGKQSGLFTAIFIQNATRFIWRLSLSVESVFQKVTLILPLWPRVIAHYRSCLRLQIRVSGLYERGFSFSLITHGYYSL